MLVLHQLKRLLSDDCLVWHDIPVGTQARQPDFFIFSPRQRACWRWRSRRRDALAGGNKDSVQMRTPHSLVTSANPLRRARDDSMELVNLMAAAPPWRKSRNISGGKLLFSLWLGRGFFRVERKGAGRRRFLRSVSTPQTAAAKRPETRDLKPEVDKAHFQQAL